MNIKCQHCGQPTAANRACRHCGAPPGNPLALKTELPVVADDSAGQTASTATLARAPRRRFSWIAFLVLWAMFGPFVPAFALVVVGSETLLTFPLWFWIFSLGPGVIMGIYWFFWVFLADILFPKVY